MRGCGKSVDEKGRRGWPRRVDNCRYRLTRGLVRREGENSERKRSGGALAGVLRPLWLSFFQTPFGLPLGACSQTRIGKLGAPFSFRWISLGERTTLLYTSNVYIYNSLTYVSLCACVVPRTGYPFPEPYSDPRIENVDDWFSGAFAG